MKNKQPMIKIVLCLIISLFIVSFFQFIFYPNNTYAVGNELNWENPNKNGDNPYKINTDAILNSQTMMQVVGCTGLVDKVSTYTTDFLKNQANKLIQKIWKKKAKDAAKNKSCEAVKASVASALAGVVNTEYATAVVDKIDCKDVQLVSDGDTAQAIDSQTAKEEASKKREECFNGLAYTLAKNQLTSMTRQTVSWINTGFDGNPMYVQNITSLNNSIEKNILEMGIEELSNGAFPYGRDFSRSIVKNYNSGGLKYGAANFLDSMTSDLAAFITDEDSYFSDPNGNENTKTPYEISKNATDRFANDFSTGGWNGWLALTQKPQNNPLGFTMMTSQYLADKIEQNSNETKDELLTNNGFLSQKKCTKWQLFDNKGKPLTKTNLNFNYDNDYEKPYEYVYSENKDESVKPNYDKCVEYQTVTPGSIIKDKLTTYVNSPERQLELADTINKSLNSLFTSLIEKFRSEGLFGLSVEKYAYNDSNMGTGLFSNNLDYEDELSGGTNSGGFRDDSFDLTRDLGNTYIHDSVLSLGNWNAKTNTPELNVGLAPYNETEKEYYGPNVYYKVTVAGNKKLFNNGYNGWAVGDRAFWNGKEWQNWKKGQTSPVDKRGVIQMQNDYVVAAKDILMVLPSIMPKLGELDYCLPGPNPYFKTNSGDTTAAFQELAGSLQSMYKDGSFFKRDTTTFSLAQPGSTVYENYRSIFKNTSNSLWTSITKSIPWISMLELGYMGEIKKDRGEEKTQNNIDYLINEINHDINKFFNEYSEKVFVGTYGTMKSEFKYKENQVALDKNPSYLPVAKDAENIVKDIISYNEDISTAIEDYNTAIIQAQTNAQTLNQIKNEVSKIIKEAQETRDKQLIKNLNEANAQMNELAIETCKAEQIQCDNETENVAQCLIEYNKCIEENVNSEGIMTLEEYKLKYAQCFDEENIMYYDDNDIMNDLGGDEALRCHDNIDNDLDGLIDNKDPDCSNITPTFNYECKTNSLSVNVDIYEADDVPPPGEAINIKEGKACEFIQNESSCNSSYFYVDLSDENVYRYKTMGCIWSKI